MNKNKLQDEEYNDERPRSTWKWWATKLLLKVVVGVALAVGLGRAVDVATVWATTQYGIVREKVLDLVTVERVRTEYKEPSEGTLADLVTRASAEQHIDPLILAVIADKESGGGKARYHFEPEMFESLRASGKYKGVSTDELRMLCSSHGVFHVLGHTAQRECDLPWHALYQPLTSARCAASIVARHWKETSGLSANPGKRLREVFKRYNGSGPMAERYADDAMERVATEIYKGMGK